MAKLFPGFKPKISIKNCKDGIVVAARLDNGVSLSFIYTHDMIRIKGLSTIMKEINEEIKIMKSILD